MKKSSELEAVLLLKEQFKIAVKRGDKEDAKRIIQQMSEKYKKITGKNLKDMFSGESLRMLQKAIGEETTNSYDTQDIDMDGKQH